jgi:hypothetical protein
MQEANAIEYSRKMEFAKFARLLATIDVKENPDDKHYLAKELNENAWVHAINFFHEMCQYKVDAGSALASLTGQFHVYMYSAFPGKSTPTTVEELREHLTKSRGVGARSSPDEFDMKIPAAGYNVHTKIGDGEHLPAIRAVPAPEDTGMKIAAEGVNTNPLVNPGIHDQDDLLDNRYNLRESAENSYLTFGVTHTTERCVDLNWQRLRNMAQPIVDMQLAKLAMNDNWKNSPIQVNLGTLLVDHTSLPINLGSWIDEEEDNMILGKHKTEKRKHQENMEGIKEECTKSPESKKKNQQHIWR